MSPREVRAIARRVACQRRVTRWQAWKGRRMLGAAPAKTIGHEKADAEAWARRMFPSVVGVTVKGVC